VNAYSSGSPSTRRLRSAPSQSSTASSRLCPPAGGARAAVTPGLGHKPAGQHAAISARPWRRGPPGSRRCGLRAGARQTIAAGVAVRWPNAILAWAWSMARSSAPTRRATIPLAKSTNGVSRRAGPRAARNPPGQTRPWPASPRRSRRTPRPREEANQSRAARIPRIAREPRPRRGAQPRERPPNNEAPPRAPSQVMAANAATSPPRASGPSVATSVRDPGTSCVAPSARSKKTTEPATTC